MDSKELKRRYQQGDRSFHKAQLQNVNLTWLTLSDADFTAANFENANLISVTLKDVNLSGAVLNFANLSRADLTNANLCGANLEGANLDGAILTNAVYDLQTQFPIGFDPSVSGAQVQGLQPSQSEVSNPDNKPEPKKSQDTKENLPSSNEQDVLYRQKLQDSLARTKPVLELQGGSNPQKPESSPPPIKKVDSSSGEVLKLNIPEAPALELVQIPSGSFEMGSNEHETEKPIHTVTLKSFWMGRYPVTQEQYKAVMGNNPSHFKGDLNRPVEYVRWHDAITFCKKLSQQIGQTISLPSEAQWEYACRAGTASRYCYGDEEGQLKDYAWFIGNSNSQTHPVGERKPNPWGLYDMHGNVWEWCQDHWHGDYNGAPRDGDAWIDRGKNNNHPRLLRGGSWYGTSRNCRSANRVRNSADNRSDYFGFRVALSSGPGSS
ncbi:MAG: SUMF1/EgtB/PvdO family nonheme iron enzyme [Thermosynechococcaceae cyanobacterium MS004]|nr:SUMF1/EgtB/PvdO family nonheme iron enzyme [Thermosynechococcaceae cyanobacterium MS004]